MPVSAHLAFHEADVEDEQRSLDVLVRAVMRLTHAALGPMLAPVAATSSTSRAWLAPAARHLCRVEGLGDELQLLGGRALRSARRSGDGVGPGFVHTEFHQRMDADMSDVGNWMWLDADDLVRIALKDLRAGKSVSIPSVRYKVLTAWPVPHRAGSSSGSPVAVARLEGARMSTPRSLALPDGIVASVISTPRGGFATLRCSPGSAPVRGSALLVPGFTGSKEDFGSILACSPRPVGMSSASTNAASTKPGQTRATTSHCAVWPPMHWHSAAPRSARIRALARALLRRSRRCHRRNRASRPMGEPDRDVLRTDRFWLQSTGPGDVRPVGRKRRPRGDLRGQPRAQPLAGDRRRRLPRSRHF